MTGQRRSKMSDSVCDLWSTEPWPLQLAPGDCKRAERVTAMSQCASSGRGVRGGVAGQEDDELVKARAESQLDPPAALSLGFLPVCVTADRTKP